MKKAEKKNYVITLETAEPTSEQLVKFLTSKGITTKIIEKDDTSSSGFDEIEYKAGSKKILIEMLNMFWHDETLKENIEEE